MDAIEKIARDICWHEFPLPGRVDKTKAQYWRGVADERKAEYRRDAEWLCFIIKAIPIDTLNLIHDHDEPQRTRRERP